MREKREIKKAKEWSYVGVDKSTNPLFSINIEEMWQRIQCFSPWNKFHIASIIYVHIKWANMCIFSLNPFVVFITAFSHFCRLHGIQFRCFWWFHSLFFFSFFLSLCLCFSHARCLHLSNYLFVAGEGAANSHWCHYIRLTHKAHIRSRAPLQRESYIYR